MILHHYCALPLYKGCSATILNFQITIKNGRDEWIRTTALQILSLLPLPLGYIPITYYSFILTYNLVLSRVKLVGMEGVEPPRLSAVDFESTTSAIPSHTRKSSNSSCFLPTLRLLIDLRE